MKRATVLSAKDRRHLLLACMVGGSGAALAARVGPIAGALLTLARGFDVQAIAPAPLPRRLLARASFEMPLTSLEEFRFPLRRLLDELLVRVRRDGAAVGIGALLKLAGLVASRGEGNRLIDGAGVRVDGSPISDKGLKLGAGTYVLQVGKRRFARVTLA